MVRNASCCPPRSTISPKIYEAEPKARIVAGSTDVGLWVTKFMRDIAPVVHLSHLDELRRITVDENGITLGAGVSYTEAYPVIIRAFPATDRTLEPHRRPAGAQHGHDRRQHRQWLADR